MLIAAGQYDEAIRGLRALAQTAGNGPAARLRVANVFFLQGKYSDAAVELKSIANPEESFDVAYYLGRCYLEMEEPDLARTYFELALKKKPDSAEVYYRLGMFQVSETKQYRSSRFPFARFETRFQPGRCVDALGERVPA